MADPLTLLFLLGATLFVGFFAQWLFDKTKIPDLLVLIVLGVLIGPVSNAVSPASFAALAPFFAPLALILLLFDGGLRFNLYRLLTDLKSASLFTLLTFGTTSALVAVVAHYGLSMPWLIAAFLGVIVAGTDSGIVLSLVSRVRADDRTRSTLVLEATLTDVFSVVFALVLLQFILEDTISASAAAAALAASFSIAAVTGVVAALVWIRILNAWRQRPFAYLLTVAALFLLYTGVEAVRGNGAMTVFVFGLILGNASQLNKAIPIGEIQFAQHIKTFQAELGFFVRTFFFVYLGIILTPQNLTLPVLGLLAGTLVAILIARVVTVRVSEGLGLVDKRFSPLVIVTLPRGLATVVLATLPAAYGISAPLISEVSILVVVAAAIITTIGVFLYERNAPTGNLAPNANPTSGASKSGTRGPKIVSLKP